MIPVGWHANSSYCVSMGPILWAARSRPGANMAETRVLIVDDHAVVRSAIADYLKAHAGLDIIAHATNGEEAVAMAERLHPDIVLMDVSLPRINGIEATRRIMDRCPGTRVIGLSMHNGDAMGAAMISAGAVGYIPKFAPPEDLVSAIRAARADALVQA